ncbi:hypothetical protein J6524_07035 [Bradyrhizobium sp. WSM 1738]|uniref:DUF6719 family protein n=1 Tax=Bradyrhizobium hereditatis TaxID=2821405 RepID=UPI001CE3713D|nr:DUF6719 family protein [Bradyrhizobium hereditatis]MCA6114673.1 hypothetical protein [Bradyrhizobium hereditatis]
MLLRRARFKGIDEVTATISSPGRWRTAAGVVTLLALFTAQPSFAQKIYFYEPLMMDPYSTIYVNDGSCSAGKVLRVQGAPKNQRRKKSCVPMSDLQAVPRPGAAR